MAGPITKHGAWGYKRGCRCEACRKAHTEANARWRGRRRDRAAEAVREQPVEPVVDLEAPLRDPVDAPAGLDLTCEAGPIEKALLEDLADPDDKVAFRRHRVAIARNNARMLDQIATGRIDRFDLVSPIELRQQELLNQLALLGFRGLGDDGGEQHTDGVAAAAEQILADIAREGSGESA